VCVCVCVDFAVKRVYLDGDEMTSQGRNSSSSSSSSIEHWSTPTPMRSDYFANDSVTPNYSSRSRRHRGVSTQNVDRVVHRSSYLPADESDEDTQPEMKQASELTFVT